MRNLGFFRGDQWLSQGIYEESGVKILRGYAYTVVLRMTYKDYTATLAYVIPIPAPKHAYEESRILWG